MRKYIPRLATALALLTGVGLSACSDENAVTRIHLSSLLSNTKATGSWSIEVQDPSVANHQSYIATLAFNGDRDQSVVVTKDRWGNRFVRVHVAEGSAFLKEGVCLFASGDGVPCSTLDGGEWQLIFVSSLNLAWRRGAKI